MQAAKLPKSSLIPGASHSELGRLCRRHRRSARRAGKNGVSQKRDGQPSIGGSHAFYVDGDGPPRSASPALEEPTRSGPHNLREQLGSRWGAVRCIEHSRSGSCEPHPLNDCEPRSQAGKKPVASAPAAHTADWTCQRLNDGQLRGRCWVRARALNSECPYPRQRGPLLTGQREHGRRRG